MTQPTTQTHDGRITILAPTPTIRSHKSETRPDVVTAKTWSHMRPKSSAAFRTFGVRIDTLRSHPPTRQNTPPPGVSHPTPHTRHPTPGTRTRHPAPGTRHPAPGTHLRVPGPPYDPGPTIEHGPAFRAWAQYRRRRVGAPSPRRGLAPFKEKGRGLAPFKEKGRRRSRGSREEWHDNRRGLAILLTVRKAPAPPTARRGLAILLTVRKAPAPPAAWMGLVVLPTLRRG